MQTHTQLKTSLSKGRGKCYQLKLEADCVYSKVLDCTEYGNTEKPIEYFFKHIVIKNVGHKLHLHVSENNQV